MFSFRKKAKGTDICAVVKGTIKPLDQVEDPAFSKGMIGQGIAVIPEDSIIKAPCDCTLNVVFPSGHAFGFCDADGLEYLIHIGIDTVKLNGKGFHLLVEQDQRVKKGDPLVEVDFHYIKEQKLSTDTMVLVTTPKESLTFTLCASAGAFVSEQDVLFHCEKR